MPALQWEQNVTLTFKVRCQDHNANIIMHRNFNDIYRELILHVHQQNQI